MDARKAKPGPHNIHHTATSCTVINIGTFRMDEGLPGFRRVVDDIVVYDSDVTQHRQRFLQRCAEKLSTDRNGNSHNSQSILQDLSSQPKDTTLIRLSPRQSNRPSLFHWPVISRCNCTTSVAKTSQRSLNEHSNKSKIHSRPLTKPDYAPSDSSYNRKLGPCWIQVPLRC